MKKNFLRSTVLATFMLSAIQLVQAQAPGSGGPTPDPTPDATDVPLDGGASLLLAGGVAYGLRRLRARQAAR